MAIGGLPPLPVRASWVILKFGGTSVSTPERWATIAGLVRQRTAEGLRPLVVCSALSGISNQLEALLAAAVEGRQEEPLAGIERRHLELGKGLGLDAAPLLKADLDELSRLALAASLLREAGPTLKARVVTRTRAKLVGDTLVGSYQAKASGGKVLNGTFKATRGS